MKGFLLGAILTAAPALGAASPPGFVPQAPAAEGREVPAAAPRAAESFRVVCDHEGPHEGLTYRSAQLPTERPSIYTPTLEEEVSMVRDLLSELVPALPPELRGFARRLTYMVNHSDVELGTLFKGWSAEDDPSYRLGDKGLYPEGTIKVNFSPQFIMVIASSRRAITDERLRSFIEDMRRSVLGIAGHEILHARQYHRRPVRDLARVPGACPTKGTMQGLCRKDLIEETKLKVEYEAEAYRFEKTLNPKTPDWETLAAGYEAQYVPAEIAWRLHELNARASSPESESEKGSLAERWDAIRSLHDYEEIEASYPYLKAVGARIELELGR